MLSTNDIPSCEIEKDNLMWRWVEDAHLPLQKGEILKKLNGRKQRCTSIVRLFQLFRKGKACWSQNRLYILPSKLDRLVSDLSELSLTHTIVGINTPGYGIEVALIESPDHTSNIDAEVMEAIVTTKSRRLA